jgi:hypothetical protein
MLSSKRKPDIKQTRDGRLILRGMAYSKMKGKLRELAENKCERCGKFTMQGDVEHITIRGMGAAKRDDRIFLEGDDGKKVRNLLYLCRGCHNGRHQGEKPVPAKPTEAQFDELLGL